MKTYAYYLHTNGDLICKPIESIESDSPFVKKIWTLDPKFREDAWLIVLESLALNANIDRVKELVKKWECTMKDLCNYMVRVETPTELEIEGLNIFLEKICHADPETWFKEIALIDWSNDEDFKQLAEKYDNVL